MKTPGAFLLLLFASALPLPARVTATRNGANLATRNYPSAASAVAPVTVTLAGEPGLTVTATVDGTPLALGATLVWEPGYHEVYETKAASTGGTPVTTLAFQFIIAGPGRGTTEMGLPVSEPWPLVNDAPSAFAGQNLQITAPAQYPLNLPVPIVARLKKGPAAGAATGDPLFLNGVVSSGKYPSRSLQLKRGWGSTILPPATEAGVRNFEAKVNGLAVTAPIEYESSTQWTTKNGALTGNEAWPAGSRIDLTATLTVKDGAALNVGPGTVIRAAPGVEIWIEPGGTVILNGTPAQPVVISPASTAAPWGGFWLHQSSVAGKSAALNATDTLFCCWGANQNWYTVSGVTPSRGIFSRHRQQQPCFAIGTRARCVLTDCAMIGPVTAGETRGAGFALQDGTLSLNGTFLQRCITGGEQVGGSVEIHRSALFDMTEPGTSPDDGTAFDDSDNDGIYLVPGAGNAYRISKTLIGWTKDDGIDSGANGPGTVTCDGCWFESCTHEAFSNSGGNRVPETRNSVHFNNGQGMECGYGDSGTGPQSLVDRCLMIGNLCGVRYGDNYSSMGTYGGTITVRDSLLLHNTFRDAFAMEWRSSSNWSYQDARLVLQNSKLTRPEDLAHQQGAEDTPASSLWDPDVDGPQLAGFMPVPDSAVGVALLHSAGISPVSLYPGDGVFHVRLSTFSSKTVTVPWSVIGKVDRTAAADLRIASGTIIFSPGETVKFITAPLPELVRLEAVRVALGAVVNAEATGRDAWFTAMADPVTETVLAKGSGGWDYYANRTPAASAQKPLDDAAGRTWTAADYSVDATWKTGKTAPIGWGNLGASAPFLPLGTTLPGVEQGITTYFRKTFTVSNPASIRSLQLQLLSDDGAVAFINGVPFPPVNVDPGTSPGGVSGIASDTLATSTKGDGPAETTYDALDAGSAVLGALKEGPNVLAIEIHQGGASSGDAVADAALVLTRNPPGSGPDGGGISVLSLDQRSFLLREDAVSALEESTDLLEWTAVPQAENPFPVPADSSPRKFYRLRK
ncbi:MAG: hypothetical protein JWM59_2233 [Verrucomicrobiales bacterium]|nr:hypothetical protein [Verrucomicrobiales bacterium]